MEDLHTKINSIIEEEFSHIDCYSCESKDINDSMCDICEIEFWRISDEKVDNVTNKIIVSLLTENKVREDKMLSAKELRKENTKADKEIGEAIYWMNKEIIKSNEKGHTRTAFLYRTSEYANEIKDYYLKLGYRFEPKQFTNTIYICW